MNRSIINRIAIGAVVCSHAVACSHGGDDAHVARAADAAARADAGAARLIAAARAKLAERRGTAAVALAEKAVAASPGNGDARLVLGQSYLATGRFASAETALQDALTIAPDQPRARLALALALSGRGRIDQAREKLEGLRGRVPAADLGLALTLAGDRRAGIAVLTDAVREGKSDVRTRQNLALAFALDGRWLEARGMAMQDTPPDRLREQIAEWAAIAGPGREAAQVATMLGTAPAIGDPGQPARLALAASPDTPPVVLAAATPAVPVPPVAILPAPLEMPVPALSSLKPVPALPALIAAPAPLRRVAAVAVAPGPMLARPVQSAEGWVVQLGAYSSTTALGAAWSEASRLSPRVATFSPARGSTSVSGAVLMRLSIGAFPARAEAVALCRQIKTRGGACFVRRAADDTPLRWTRRETGTRLAMG